MRLDYLTIFPDYLAPLSLSLPGKAAARGLVDVHVHDLRDWAHDKHRSVDDTPYGGGAGMVMKPGPWGEALDELLPDGSTGPETGVVVVVPTPSGRPFTQAQARELAGAAHLVFLCGRYEGIDQRVLDHAATRAQVREVSLGDYVLNGGEVAALAVTEAVVRLLPGFMGNAASLTEESHEGGLLEYPVYTKPASWRGLEVPEVLLGGDHGAVARWRHDQAVRRTVARRPDLLPPTAAAGEWVIESAVPADAAELLTLQLACWVPEALVNDDLTIPPLREGLGDVQESIATWQTWVVRVDGRLVGSVRGRQDGATWHIGRLMVAPDLRGRGLGRLLLEHVQATASPGATTYRLLTGKASVQNLRIYRKAGFRVREVLDGPSGPAVLVKEIS